MSTAAGWRSFGHTTTRSGRSRRARLAGPNSGCVAAQGTRSARCRRKMSVGFTLTLATSSTICPPVSSADASSITASSAGTGTARTRMCEARTRSPGDSAAYCAGTVAWGSNARTRMPDSAISSPSERPNRPKPRIPTVPTTASMRDSRWASLNLPAFRRPAPLGTAGDGPVRIVLFNPAPRSGWQVQRRIELPLGLLWVATPLDGPGWDVCIVEEYGNRRWRTELVEALRGECVCFGVTSMTGPQLLHAVRACQVVRQQRPGLPIVWGGIHASLLPEQTLRSGWADVVVVGEGEETFPRSRRTRWRPDGRSDSVAGIAYLDDGRLPGRRRLGPTSISNAQPPLSYRLIRHGPLPAPPLRHGPCQLQLEPWMPVSLRVLLGSGAARAAVAGHGAGDGHGPPPARHPRLRHPRVPLHRRLLLRGPESRARHPRGRRAERPRHLDQQAADPGRHNLPHGSRLPRPARAGQRAPAHDWRRERQPADAGSHPERLDDRAGRRGERTAEAAPDRAGLPVHDGAAGRDAGAVRRRASRWRCG